MSKIARRVVTTTVALVMSSGLTGCQPHPETRAVVKKGVDASGPFVICRSSWVDNSNVPHHSDQRKEMDASAYAAAKVGDPC